MARPPAGLSVSKNYNLNVHQPGRSIIYNKASISHQINITSVGALRRADARNAFRS